MVRASSLGEFAAAGGKDIEMVMRVGPLQTSPLRVKPLQ